MYTDCSYHRLYLHTSSLSDQSTLIRHSLDHSTQTHYLSHCLGSAGGYSNYFWNDSKNTDGKSSETRTLRRGACRSDSKSVSEVIIIRFCWIQSGLTPLINHRSGSYNKVPFYSFLCFGSTSTLSCRFASLGYRSRSRRYTTVLEVVTSHT